MSKTEHTKELQVESAFKIFDEVLKLQRTGDILECYKLYESLLKLKVISGHYDDEELFIKGLQNAGSNTIPDELNYVSSNLKTLRYLIFRNRAFFYLDVLKSGTKLAEIKTLKTEEPVLEFDVGKELFYTLLDDLGNALYYQEADNSLITVLTDVLLYLRAYRLARFVLEYLLSSKKESDDILGLLPLDKLFITRHRLLVQKINYDVSFDEVAFESDISKLEAKYVYLKPFREDYFNLIESASSPRVKVCKIKTKGDTIKWENVTNSINEMVKLNEDKSRIETTSRLKLKDIDPYFFTSSSVDILRLEIPNVDSDNEALEENNSEIDDVEGDATDEQDKAAGDFVEVEPKNAEITHDSPNVDKADDMEVDEEAGDSVAQEASTEATSSLPNETQIPDVGQTETPETETNDDVEIIKDKPSTDLETDAKETTPKSDTEITKKNSQRASKRLQKNDLDSSYWYPDVEVTPKMFSETKVFFQEINRFFGNPERTKAIELSDISVSFTKPEENEQYVQDFIELLNDFDPPIFHCAFVESRRLKQARILKNDDGENQRLKLLDVLKSFSNSESNNYVHPKIEEHYPETTIFDFINLINQSNCHLIDIKIGVLKNLLGVNANNLSPVCDLQWPNRLLEDVKIWVIQLEEQLVEESMKTISKNIASDTLQCLAFTVGVYELLVDSYIQQKTKIDSTIALNVSTGFQKSFKASLNTQISSLSKMRNVLDRWKSHIDSILFNLDEFFLKDTVGFKSYVRFKWAVISKEKADNSNFRLSQYITTELSQLSKLIEDTDEKFVVAMPNYKHITSLDLHSISLLTNTVIVLTMFAKILNSKGNDLSHLEAISILERTLIDGSYFNHSPSSMDSQAIASVKNLLSQSSTDMKYSLWTILFQYYSTSNDLKQFQFGFERVLETMFDDITNENYKKLELWERRVSLLKILSLFGEYLFMYTECVSKNSWKLDLSDKKSLSDSFQKLTKLFELCYMFSLHEEAALITSRKTSVTEKSKSCYDIFTTNLIKVITVMVVYYDATTSADVGNTSNKVNESTLDLLSMIHDQLGFRRLCDAGEGIFLKMFQDILAESNIYKRQNDALQLLYCRNHCKISANDFTPATHETVTTELIDKVSVYRISKFVLPLCLDKSPLESPPKGDLKGIIDKFFEVVGKPEYESASIIDKNSKILTEFLSNTRITPTFVRECFYGLHSISLFPVDNDETVQIVQDGLYYLEALLMLQSFKVRRASGSGKSLEIENAIELLKFDLLYGSDRVESWLLLGEAYGFLVEDDLLWTPDKLSVPEKKVVTGNVQRKSLLCYLMAMNFSKTAKPKDVKACVSELMSNFSKEFFNSCMIPMEMAALKTIDSPLFLQKNDETKMVNTTEKPMMTKKFCLKIIQQTLHLAIKANKVDCINYYFLGKVQGKLGLPIETIVETLKISCSYSSKKEGNQDIIVEPHYKLCSIIYKAVKSDKMSIEEAVGILQDDIIFKPAEFQGQTKEDFFRYVISCLKLIVSFDKRKWQHKYHYRIAKIHSEDFKDVKSAIEEMSSLVTTKPTSKSLVQFWKPDIERPGKHFFYTFQYVTYYIELLSTERNLGVLTSIYPRLRKSTAIMVSLNVAWEQLCSSICKIVRWAFDVKDSFTDSFLNTPINLFWAHLKTVAEKLKKSDLPQDIQPALHLLNILSDIKKLNNGFGPTSLIDDTIVAVFINIYYSIPQQETTDSLESPVGKVKKLAKKDIFPCTTDILKNCKREMDMICKEKPDLLDDFIANCEQKFQAKDAKLIPDSKADKTSVSDVTNLNTPVKKDTPNKSSSETPEVNGEERFYTPSQGDEAIPLVIIDSPLKESKVPQVSERIEAVQQDPSQNKREIEQAEDSNNKRIKQA